MTFRYLSIWIAISLTGLLASCGNDTAKESTVYDNTAEVEEYYRAHPERFVTSSVDKLPAQLDWQDGSDLPTFGDPRARRGGELKLRLTSMQQTLRMLGPDANGTLRGPLWSANTVSFIERHPWADGYTPGLAREWAVDPDDSRTIYLRLDPDARWSDGKPFSIDDVFFSLYFLLSPHLNDPAVNRVMDENITRITRYDDETFAISQTNRTTEPLGIATSFMIVQRDFYREFGTDYVDRYHWRFAPVTGPYTLDESKVKRGRRITFDRLENWWADDKPFYRYRFNPKELTYLVIRDNEKAFESFLKGDIHWHFLNQTDLWYDRNDPAINEGFVERSWVYHQLPAASEGIHMNAMHPKLVDRNIRLGIQHALDFEKVNAGLFRGDRRRIRTFSDGYGAYSHPTLRARAYDPVEAAKYFHAAGFTSRGGDGILVNDNGEKLSFVLTVANRNDEVTQATILKEQALSAGLELKLEVMDQTAFFTKLFEKNHQLVKTAWNTGYSPAPTFQWELRGSDAGKPSNFNTTNINDPELNDLLTEWDGLDDPIRGQEIAHRIQERIHEFAAWAPGLTIDYNRLGYWRWIRWPEYFQVPRYFFFSASGVFWIDEEREEETRRAQEDGMPFEPVTNIYDRWQRE